MRRKSPYEMGVQHGSKSLRFLAHRRGRLYDSRHAQEAYERGFNAGRTALVYGAQQKLSDELFGKGR